MKTAAQYRAAAREQLGGNIFADNWLYTLLVTLLIGIVAALLSSTVIGSVLALGFLSFGAAGIFLNLARGAQSVNLNDMFVAKDYWADALLLSLLRALIIFLWSLLFVIPGILKAYSYAITFHLHYDHPEYDWRKCLDESTRIMQGNRWRLFCLHLSFIGWLLIGCLTCGIGMLWVIPYISAAQANFYEDLTRQSVSE